MDTINVTTVGRIVGEHPAGIAGDGRGSTIEGRVYVITAPAEVLDWLNKRGEGFACDQHLASGANISPVRVTLAAIRAGHEFDMPVHISTDLPIDVRAACLRTLQAAQTPGHLHQLRDGQTLGDIDIGFCPLVTGHVVRGEVNVIKPAQFKTAQANVTGTDKGGGAEGGTPAAPDASEHKRHHHGPKFKL